MAGALSWHRVRARIDGVRVAQGTPARPGSWMSRWPPPPLDNDHAIDELTGYLVLCWACLQNALPGRQADAAQQSQKMRFPTWSPVHCPAMSLEERQAKVREVFDEFDSDKSGSISSTEIKSAMSKLVGADLVCHACLASLRGCRIGVGCARRGSVLSGGAGLRL